MKLIIISKKNYYINNDKFLANMCLDLLKICNNQIEYIKQNFYFLIYLPKQ